MSADDNDTFAGVHPIFSEPEKNWGGWRKTGKKTAVGTGTGLHLTAVGLELDYS